MESHDRDITNVSSKGTGFLERMNQSNEDSPTYVSVSRRFLRLLRRVLSRQKNSRGISPAQHLAVRRWTGLWMSACFRPEAA